MQMCFCIWARRKKTDLIVPERILCICFLVFGFFFYQGTPWSCNVIEGVYASPSIFRLSWLIVQVWGLTSAWECNKKIKKLGVGRRVDIKRWTFFACFFLELQRRFYSAAQTSRYWGDKIRQYKVYATLPDTVMNANWHWQCWRSDFCAKHSFSCIVSVLNCRKHFKSEQSAVSEESHEQASRATQEPTWAEINCDPGLFDVHTEC